MLCFRLAEPIICASQNRSQANDLLHLGRSILATHDGFWAFQADSAWSLVASAWPGTAEGIGQRVQIEDLMSGYPSRLPLKLGEEGARSIEQLRELKQQGKLKVLTRIRRQFDRDERTASAVKGRQGYLDGH